MKKKTIRLISLRELMGITLQIVGFIFVYRTLGTKLFGTTTIEFIFKVLTALLLSQLFAFFVMFNFIKYTYKTTHIRLSKVKGR